MMLPETAPFDPFESAVGGLSRDSATDLARYIDGAISRLEEERRIVQAVLAVKRRRVAAGRATYLAPQDRPS